MADHRVTCITKSPSYSTQHEHITRIGNPAEGWNITREDAIHRIDSKTDNFYVYDAGKNKTSYVGVVRPIGRDAYLRTHADGDWNDNLLSLGSC